MKKELNLRLIVGNSCSLTQSHRTLFDPMDSRPPGFYVHGTLQAQILEWVAISHARGSSDSGVGPGEFFHKAGMKMGTKTNSIKRKLNCYRGVI